jgi:phospholipase C
METILPQIDHLIVLMLENRAFDHLIGSLTLEEGRTDVDRLTPGMANGYEGVIWPACSDTTDRV